MSLVYAIIPFLNVIFTYGLETTFFRYMQREEYRSDIYNTAMVSIICSTFFLTAVLILFNNDVAKLISIRKHPEYITWSALIIAFDTLTALPFAKLRQEGRPIKFAFVRIVGILIYIGFIYFFLSICPILKAEHQTVFGWSFIMKTCRLDTSFPPISCRPWFPSSCFRKNFLPSNGISTPNSGRNS